MKEWIEDATEWVKDRVQERTTWDGVMSVSYTHLTLPTSVPV